MNLRQEITVKAIDVINNLDDGGLKSLSILLDKVGIPAPKKEATKVDNTPEAIVEEGMKKEEPPMDILKKLIHAEPPAPETSVDTSKMTKAQCMQVLKDKELELTEDVDLPTLRTIIAELLEPELEVEEKVEDTAVTSDKFDYKNINLKDEEDDDLKKHGTIDDRINDLIVKIAGPAPSNSELMYVVKWQEKFTPQQILNCLKVSYAKSAQTLKLTNSLLNIKYGENDNQQMNQQGMQKGQKIGNFRLG